MNYSSVFLYPNAFILVMEVQGTTPPMQGPDIGFQLAERIASA